MIETTLRDKNAMEKVEKAVCKYFNVTSDDIVNMGRPNNTVLARDYLFYILHVHYNFSGGKISLNYKRTVRTVLRSFSKVRHQIKFLRVHKNIYNDLLDMIYK